MAVRPVVPNLNGRSFLSIHNRGCHGDQGRDHNGLRPDHGNLQRGTDPLDCNLQRSAGNRRRAHCVVASAKGPGLPRPSGRQRTTCCGIRERWRLPLMALLSVHLGRDRAYSRRFAPSRIGTALLKDLIGQAGALHKHIMVAGVDSENTASLRYLERFGFERAGLLREVGFKFDRFLDLVLLQYWITTSATRNGRSGSQPS